MTTSGARAAQLVALPGDVFLMGSDDRRYPDDAEAPPRPVRVAPFRIAPRAVSNAEFAAFVANTGHVTTAERDGWSYTWGGLLPTESTAAVVATPWWCRVPGASWLHPEGLKSTVDERPDHPVVHVSWLDADAYCRWAGVRLPSEAEWEYAARGGLEQCSYPWGDEARPGGVHRMNVFQGRFPGRDTAEDGYAGTAPVDAFPPNGFGLYNMTGNVWEWCANWFGGRRRGERATRGGSYLCHESHCWRCRTSGRSANAPDRAAGNIGFRVAAAR